MEEASQPALRCLNLQWRSVKSNGWHRAQQNLIRVRPMYSSAAFPDFLVSGPKSRPAVQQVQCRYICSLRSIKRNSQNLLQVCFRVVLSFYVWHSLREPAAAATATAVLLCRDGAYLVPQVPKPVPPNCLRGVRAS
jgi:hypothetical protein